MGLSPAQRYRQRLQAEQTISRGSSLVDCPDSLHIQLIALKQDVARVRDLPRNGLRTTLKRELLVKWQPYVEQYIQFGNVYQNLIFSYCVVWLFDIGDLGQALDWSEIAISQGQKTPDNFKSTFAAFTADQVLEWAIVQSEAGNSIEPYFSRTFTNVTEKWQLHEKITAKWYKFAGLHLLRDHQGRTSASAVDSVEVLQKADELLANAEKNNRSIGVRTIRERIAMRIRALTE